METTSKLVPMPAPMTAAPNGQSPENIPLAGSGLCFWFETESNVMTQAAVAVDHGRSAKRHFGSDHKFSD